MHADSPHHQGATKELYYVGQTFETVGELELASIRVWYSKTLTVAEQNDILHWYNTQFERFRPPSACKSFRLQPFNMPLYCPMVPADRG